MPLPMPSPTPPPPSPSVGVWFGEGCFWKRQFAYALVELDPAGPFKRNNASVSSVVGYAGSLDTAGGQVCYDARANVSVDYGELGHAEQVRIDLGAGMQEAQFAALVADFFRSFNATESGFIRPDPGNAGGPYRVTVGLPGGVNGKLYSVLEDANAPRGPYNLTMVLREDRVGSVDDAFNTVFVMDSDIFPFFQAEQYHQFHSDVYAYDGYYPDWYRHDLWQLQIDLGRLPFGGSTNCSDSRYKHY